MTLAVVASFQPVARNEYLDRLEALPPRPAFTAELWTRVHDEIQNQLTSLEADVRQKVPGVQVDSGRTAGDYFYLFSYRTFSMPGMAIDPVVVGMTFTPVEQSVSVEADVSGEQTGDCVASVPRKTVANSEEKLLAAVRESARNLCQSAGAIAAALIDPSRGVE